MAGLRPPAKRRCPLIASGSRGLFCLGATKVPVCQFQRFVNQDTVNALYPLLLFLGPVPSVQRTIVDGFAEMGGRDTIAAVQISDRATDS